MLRRLPALLVAALLASALSTAVAVPSEAEAAAQPAARAEPTYRPPADAPVTDPFRPPASPYGSGNRGVDLDTRPGDDVWASGAGEVVFAGPVAGDLHVVVAHPDGLRTSYSFLGSVSVDVGDHVAAGQHVGRAGGPTHFGVRAGNAYLDPDALFDEPLRVWLVPQHRVTAAEEAARRRVIDRLFDEPSVAAALGQAVGWARGVAVAGGEALHETVVLAGAALHAELLALHQELLTYGHYLHELNAAVHVARWAQAAHRWWEQRDECTPGGTPVPPSPAERRIVVLVGGLNSSSTNAAVDDVDAAALGYAAGDVIRFSYAGGRIPDPDDALRGVTASPYGPAHTRRDIRSSADLLVDMLREIRLEAPGVPVDVIAHSQGGLVARVAMHELDPLDPRNPDVGSLVTLGTPHHGADIATAAGQVARSGTGSLALLTVDQVAGLGLAPTETSVQQLSETSSFMRDLNERPLPDHVEVTSIAARTDVVVPAGRSHLDGATNTIVAVDGITAHDDLPGSADARREMALGLAGMAPTCDGFGTWMLDHVVSDTIGWGEDTLGFTTSLAARRFDFRVPGRVPAPRRTPGPVAVPALAR